MLTEGGSETLLIYLDLCTGHLAERFSELIVWTVSRFQWTSATPSFLVTTRRFQGNVIQILIALKTNLDTAAGFKLKALISDIESAWGWKKKGKRAHHKQSKQLTDLH